MLKEKVKYAFYTITHPSNGFYEIRHRQKGSVPLAILFVFLFAVCFSANRQYAGFVVNFVNPMEVNSLTEMITVFVLFILFCVGNWSVTCLMNGEGRFKDIVTMTGYSMLPMILTQIPAIIISNFVVQDEEAYYYNELKMIMSLILDDEVPSFCLEIHYHGQSFTKQYLLTYRNATMIEHIIKRLMGVPLE